MKIKKWKIISIVISTIFGIAMMIGTVILVTPTFQYAFSNEPFEYDNLKPYAIDVAKGLIDPTELDGDGLNAYTEMRENYFDVYIELEPYGLKASFPISNESITEENGTLIISRVINSEEIKYEEYKTSKNKLSLIVALMAWGLMFGFGLYCFIFILPYKVIEVTKNGKKKIKIKHIDEGIDM